MLAYCALTLVFLGLIVWRFAGLRQRVTSRRALGLGGPGALLPTQVEVVAAAPERYAGFRPVCLAIIVIEAALIGGILTVAILAAGSAYGQAESRLEAFLHGTICGAIVSRPA